MLSRSLSRTAPKSVQLLWMNSVPTTEDLRYVLATADRSQKPAELPFSNGYTNTIFVIKVVPAREKGGPVWSLSRADNGIVTNLWSKETYEVVAVQSKMKLDANSGAAIMIENSGTDAVPIITTQARTTVSKLPSLAWKSEPFAAATPSVDGLQVSGDQHTFMPDSCFRKLPPPVEMGTNITQRVMKALSDPKTGFTQFLAFSFFLEREFALFTKFGTRMSVLAFYFYSRTTNAKLQAPDAMARIVSEELHSICQSLDVYSRLESGEFVVMISGAGGEDALKFAQQLHQTLRECDRLKEHLAEDVDVYIGAASIPATCSDTGTLLSAAREASEIARERDQPYLLFPLLM